MGVVYKDQDTKLNRTLDLKFLPEGFFKDRQARERFQREVQADSALNHPNICTIYDLDEHGGQPFVATELLTGESRKHRFAGKPLKTVTPYAGLPSKSRTPGCSARNWLLRRDSRRGAGSAKQPRNRDLLEIAVPPSGIGGGKTYQ